MLTTTLLSLTLVHLCRATYYLQDDYSGSNFFNNFDFFTLDDYTHGYVNYVDQPTAISRGLINTNNGIAYMGVDSTNIVQPGARGRDSVRIQSQKAYNVGLFILDLGHMPGGACGEWPAFWTVGPNWPNNGEIDIIEGVNSATTNAMAVHTNPGCSVASSSMQSGTLVYPNCDINAQNQPSNSGCVVTTSDTSTYGAGFNAGNGGIVAMELTPKVVRIWSFTRANIPANIAPGSTAQPSPGTWGKPVGIFGVPCNMTNFVQQQSLVFDITFCGDWAGSAWNSDSTCKPKGSSCQAYVQNIPSAFKNSYWSINTLKVYQDDGCQPPRNCPPRQQKRDDIRPVEESAELVANYARSAEESGANQVPRDAMGGIVAEDELYSPHADVEQRDALAQPEPEAEAEAEANADLDYTSDDDSTLARRQGIYAGPNGLLQNNRWSPAQAQAQAAKPANNNPQKSTVTVTSTIYSGVVTKTGKPTTMLKTTPTPVAAAAVRPNNVNVMQANAFGGGQRQQQVTTKTAYATATMTKNLNAPRGEDGEAQQKYKVKMPRAWYEVPEEDAVEPNNESIPDPEVAVEEALIEEEHLVRLRERFFIVPELTPETSLETVEDDELLFDQEDLDDEDAQSEHERHHHHHHHHHHYGSNGHGHGHGHSHSHSHSHAHAHAHTHDEEADQDAPSRHHTHHIGDEKSLLIQHEEEQQKLLEESMQQARADEKRVAVLRQELAEIEQRRVREMLSHGHGGGARTGGGMAPGRKGWW